MPPHSLVVYGTLKSGLSTCLPAYLRICLGCAWVWPSLLADNESDNVRLCLASPRRVHGNAQRVVALSCLGCGTTTTSGQVKD